MGAKEYPAVLPPARSAGVLEDSCFRDTLADDAAHGLARRMPELSAHKVITSAQAGTLALVAGIIVAFSATCPDLAWSVFVALTSAAFLAGTLFRAVLAGVGSAAATHGTAAGDELPIYTILVPLYREANVLPQLVRALSSLDYPDMLAQTPQEI